MADEKTKLTDETFKVAKELIRKHGLETAFDSRELPEAVTPEMIDEMKAAGVITRSSGRYPKVTLKIAADLLAGGGTYDPKVRKPRVARGTGTPKGTGAKRGPRATQVPGLAFADLTSFVTKVQADMKNQEKAKIQNLDDNIKTARKQMLQAAQTDDLDAVEEFARQIRRMTADKENIQSVVLRDVLQAESEAKYERLVAMLQVGLQAA